MILQGQFGEGGESGNFILDTGTAPSIVNERLVAKLGLTPIPSSMSVIGKMVMAQSAVLPELRVGPIRAPSLRVQIQDLTALEHNLGLPLAGIIGMDVLAQADFRLDYDKKELLFEHTSERGIPVGFDAHTGLAVASVRIDGFPRRMLVDTGSNQIALLGVNQKGAPGIALHATSQEGSNLAEKPVPVQVFFSPDIVINEQHFSVPKAYYVSGASESSFDGLLGVRALGFHAIAYSRERESLYLQR